jgi:hypothetical protein
MPVTGLVDCRADDAHPPIEPCDVEAASGACEPVERPAFVTFESRRDFVNGLADRRVGRQAGDKIPCDREVSRRAQDPAHLFEIPRHDVHAPYGNHAADHTQHLAQPARCDPRAAYAPPSPAIAAGHASARRAICSSSVAPSARRTR